MKINLFCALVLFCLLAGPFSFSQTRPATQPQSATTGSPATGSSGTSPRRQQELYDQYNGVSKKPGQAAPAPTSGRFGNTTAAGSAVDKPVRAAADGNTSAFRIGIRGGVTRLFFLEKNALVEPTINFVGGVVFQFGAGAISFQPEVNYARFGQNVVGFGSGKIKTFADRVEVPLLVKIASGTTNGTRLFLNIGPYGAYSISQSVGGDRTSLIGKKGSIAYGAALGLGVMIKAGPGQVTVEGRGMYELGDDIESFNTDSKTIFGQATVGYMFPLGGR